MQCLCTCWPTATRPAARLPAIHVSASERLPRPHLPPHKTPHTSSEHLSGSLSPPHPAGLPSSAPQGGVRLGAWAYPRSPSPPHSVPHQTRPSSFPSHICQARGIATQLPRDSPGPKGQAPGSWPDESPSDGARPPGSLRPGRPASKRPLFPGRPAGERPLGSIGSASQWRWDPSQKATGGHPAPPAKGQPPGSRSGCGGRWQGRSLPGRGDRA